MIVQSTDQPIHEVDADAVVIGVTDFSGGPSQWDPILKLLDEKTGGQLQNLHDSGDFEAKGFSSVALYPGRSMRARMVLLVGLSIAEGHPRRSSLEAAGYAAKKLASSGYTRIAYYLPVPSLIDAIAGAIMGGQGQGIFHETPNLKPATELSFYQASEEQLVEGRTLGAATNWTRWLVNQPASEIYPESFVAEVQKELGNVEGIQVEVWNETVLEEEGCRTILAVGKASTRPPRLLKGRYRGSTSDDRVLALIGKGVTFDSGGLSLKPSDSMLDMKCDMAGAATVVGAIKAIAELKLPVNVTAYCGLAENMIAGNALKLGDVVRTRSGKTVEVLNTDAEGRLVLADVLDVAKSDKVSRMVDLATLTGACMVALGRTVAGVMSNDEPWCAHFLKAADTTGEYAWQLPMYTLYDSQIKSKVADIKNVGDGRWGGAITAGKFLQQFAEPTPWVHIDIAGPSFADRPSEWLDAGASGCFVRTLVCLAQNF